MEVECGGVESVGCGSYQGGGEESSEGSERGCQEGGCVGRSISLEKP
jgi:hypothetical protein